MRPLLRKFRKFKRLQLTDKFYAEGASAGDFNKDGKMDVVSGPYWYAGPDFADRHEIYDTKEFKPKGYAPNFNTWAYDINGDGWDDVIRVTHPGQKVFWHENPKGRGPWKPHIAMDSLENESPQFTDVTGNGLPDMVGSVAGQFVYFTFQERNCYREVDDGITFHHQSPLVVGTRMGSESVMLMGTGKWMFIDKDHWWMQPEFIGRGPFMERVPFSVHWSGRSGHVRL